MPASSVVSLSATVEILNCYMGEARGSVDCSGTPSPRQIEYSCVGELYYIPFRSLLISTMYVWAGEEDWRGGFGERGRVQLEFQLYLSPPLTSTVELNH
jgi:hypothetical protein